MILDRVTTAEYRQQDDLQGQTPTIWSKVDILTRALYSKKLWMCFREHRQLWIPTACTWWLQNVMWRNRIQMTQYLSFIWDCKEVSYISRPWGTNDRLFRNTGPDIATNWLSMVKQHHSSRQNAVATSQELMRPAHNHMPGIVVRVHAETGEAAMQIINFLLTYWSRDVTL